MDHDRGRRNVIVLDQSLMERLAQSKFPMSQTRGSTANAPTSVGFDSVSASCSVRLLQK